MLFNIFSKSKQKKSLAARWGVEKAIPLNFYQIEKYHLKRDFSNVFQVISPQTRNDIDFESLFGFVDRTSCAIGQQYLYDKLLTIEKNPCFLEQEKSIKALVSNENIRLDIQLILSKLQNTNAYDVCGLFLDPVLPKPKRFFITKVQSLLSILSFCLIFINVYFIFPFVAFTISNIFIHYSNKKYIQLYSGAMHQLVKMCKCAKALSKLWVLKDQEDILQPSLKSLNSINQTWSIFDTQIQGSPELTEFIWIILEYIKICFLIGKWLGFLTGCKYRLLI